MKWDALSDRELIVLFMKGHMLSAAAAHELWVRHPTDDGAPSRLERALDGARASAMEFLTLPEREAVYEEVANSVSEAAERLNARH